MKTTNIGLNKNKRLPRIPIQAGAKLSGNEYKFLDYNLFRDNLNNYQIHISTMVKELGMSKMTVLRLCDQYKQTGILYQDANGFYHLDYEKTELYIYSLIETPLVTNLDQTGNNLIPTGNNLVPTGNKIRPELVSNCYHTSNISNLKEIPEEDIKYAEPDLITEPIRVKTNIPFSEPNTATLKEIELTTKTCNNDTMNNELLIKDLVSLDENYKNKKVSLETYNKMKAALVKFGSKINEPLGIKNNPQHSGPLATPEEFDAVFNS